MELLAALVPLIKQYGIWPVVALVLALGWYIRQRRRRPTGPPSPERGALAKSLDQDTVPVAERLLSQHAFFRPFFVSSVQDAIRLGHLGRKLYYRDLIRIMVRAYQDQFRRIITDPPTEIRERNEWRASIRSAFAAGRTQWSLAWLSHPEAPLPQGALDHIMGYHDQSLEQYLGRVDDICLQSLVGDYYAAVNMSLLVLQTLVVDFIRDLRLADVNGDLDHLTFKSISLGPHGDD